MARQDNDKTAMGLEPRMARIPRMGLGVVLRGTGVFCGGEAGSGGGGCAGLNWTSGAARRVAQIFNLLYRRILFCQAQVISKVIEPVRRLRQVMGRLRLRAGCAGLIWASGAARRVAQIFNLLYRRIVFGKSPDNSSVSDFSHAPQIANLRYSRIQFCATPSDGLRARSADF